MPERAAEQPSGGESALTGGCLLLLVGWTLHGEDGHRYTFHDYRLAGRSTVRVHTGQGRDTDTYTDVYQDRRNYVWDNRSDTATLRNDNDRFIDESPGAATATAAATVTPWRCR